MNGESVTEEFVRTSFGNVTYLESGSPDKPAVLFSHGIPTSSYLWRHVLRFLQNDFHCLAPDLIGMGDTDADPYSNHFHMDAQAEMLWKFMKVKGRDSFRAHEKITSGFHIPSSGHLRSLLGRKILELVRIIHHSRGASLGIRYYSAFASFTNTTSIRSVAENTVIKNTVAIHSLSGELSRLALLVLRFYSRGSSEPGDESGREKTEVIFSRTLSIVAHDQDRAVLRPFLARREAE